VGCRQVIDPPALESWWLAGKSSILRLSVERRRRLCAGNVEIPSFVEKLLSGDDIEVIGDLMRGWLLSLSGDSRRVPEKT
jgi:hypothetical protein